MSLPDIVHKVGIGWMVLFSMVEDLGQVGIKHQLWPFWHPLLIYHVKDDKGDIIGRPNILPKDIKY